MTIFVPLFLVVILATVTLLLRVGFQLVLRRWIDARKSAIVLASTVFLYVTALIAVGVFSKPSDLRVGQIKCFDDWCVRLDSTRKTSNLVSIQLDTINHGRRAQAPDSPHAYLVADGKTIPVNVPKLANRIEGGLTNSIALTIAVPIDTRVLKFLVTEGGGPSELIIDDENSPFHAKSSWRL